MKLRKDWGGKQAGKGTGRHVSCVEDGHTGGDFLAGIEHGDHVECTRIERGFRDTQKESTSNHAAEALDLVGEERNDRPSQTEASHEKRRANAVEDHVGRDLATEVAHEEDGHAGVVLRALEVEVLYQGVQLAIDHSVAVEEVEKIHEPQNWLPEVSDIGDERGGQAYQHVHVQLSHESNLLGVSLCVCAELVDLLNLGHLLKLLIVAGFLGLDVKTLILVTLHRGRLGMLVCHDGWLLPRSNRAQGIRQDGHKCQ